jgi:hypothetical protein
MHGVTALIINQDKVYKMCFQNSDKINEEERKCKNCTGFSDSRCYRRPLIELFVFGPRCVDAEGTCFKFESKLHKVR